MEALTAGSLFSGVGGIDLAFALAGFDIRYQVEINPFCRKVLSKHARNYWRNAVQYADVQHCGNGRTEILPYTDVIFGGFPCQDISQAGKRAGIREGERSGLWREMRRIISEVRPRAILLENVDAIIHRGRGGVDVIAELTAVGYVGRFGVISAADAGAPHLRNRWFCVAYPDSTGKTEIRAGLGELSDNEKQHDTPTEQSRNNKLAQSLNTGQVGNSDSGIAQGNGQVWQQIASVGCESLQPERAGGQLAERRYLSESRLGRNAHGVSGGMDEIMQHQFPAPPGEQFEDEPCRTTRTRSAERLTALGNAVVPQVVYPIAKLLAEYLRANP